MKKGKTRQPLNIGEACASTVAKSAFDSGAALVLTISKTGVGCRHIAKYRPKAPILAVCHSEAHARSLNTLRGVFSLVLPDEGGTEAIIGKAIDFAKRVGFEGVVPGAQAVLVTEEKADEGAPMTAKCVKLI